MSLTSQIESLLFVSPDPITARKLGTATGAPKEAIEKALAELAEIYHPKTNRGMVLIKSGDSWQLTSHPDCAAMAADFLKSDMTGELTEPSLETLTIVAYRGPVTKPELEQIRGVNCSLILRNLLIRGLIEVLPSKKLELPRYRVTIDFLRFLGIESVEALPNYKELSEHETLNEMLAAEEAKE